MAPQEDAPAQMFIYADEDWMDYVEGKGLIKPGSRADLLGNKLVLIAPKDAKVSLELKQGADLAAALGGGRLAMGLVRLASAHHLSHRAHPEGRPSRGDILRIR